MNWNTKKRKLLLKAFSSIQDETELKAFMRDLMTEVEIDEFANRLTAASLLLNDVSYTKIEKDTHMSSTTIARVAKWLHGNEGGYKKVLKKIL